MRDVTNLGLQFGNIGFDPNRKGYAGAMNTADDDSSAQQHTAPQAVPERNTAATSNGAASSPAVDVFNGGGMHPMNSLPMAACPCIHPSSHVTCVPSAFLLACLPGRCSWH